MFLLLSFHIYSRSSGAGLPLGFNIISVKVFVKCLQACVSQIQCRGLLLSSEGCVNGLFCSRMLLLWLLTHFTKLYYRSKSVRDVLAATSSVTSCMTSLGWCCRQMPHFQICCVCTYNNSYILFLNSLQVWIGSQGAARIVPALEREPCLLYSVCAGFGLRLLGEIKPLWMDFTDFIEKWEVVRLRGS